MVKFNIKVNQKINSAYIPKELRKIMGKEVVAIPNTYSVLMFKKNTEIKKVLSSLEIIKQSLLLQMDESTE